MWNEQNNGQQFQRCTISCWRGKIYKCTSTQWNSNGLLLNIGRSSHVRICKTRYHEEMQMWKLYWKGTARSLCASTVLSVLCYGQNGGCFYVKCPLCYLGFCWQCNAELGKPGVWRLVHNLLPLSRAFSYVVGCQVPNCEHTQGHTWLSHGRQWMAPEDAKIGT
jgi:hypothetical protein